MGEVVSFIQITKTNNTYIYKTQSETFIILYWEMEGMMPNWYILFVNTGREISVEQKLKNTLNPDVYEPFIPMIETVFRRGTLVKKEKKIMFPSYVFIESQVDKSEFLLQTRRIIKLTKHAIRFLSYGDTDEIALRDEEHEELKKLCNGNKCVSPSIGVIVGDLVYISEGPLVGSESKIRKIYRHYRRAIIELNFMGSSREISVPLEIVEKI